MTRAVGIVVGICLFATAASAAVQTGALHKPRVKPNAADNALAAKVVLTIKDFGTAGWESSTVPKPYGVVLACPDFNPSASGVTETGSAASGNLQTKPSFPPYINILQHVSVFQTSAQADKIWNRTQKPAFAKCVGDTFTAFQAKFAVTQVTSGAEKITAVKPATATAAYRAAARLTPKSGGTAFTLYVDQVFLKKGRTITAITYATFPSPLTANDLSYPAGVVAKRLAANGG